MLALVKDIELIYLYKYILLWGDDSDSNNYIIVINPTIPIII